MGSQEAGSEVKARKLGTNQSLGPSLLLVGIEGLRSGAAHRDILRLSLPG